MAADRAAPRNPGGPSADRPGGVPGTADALRLDRPDDHYIVVHGTVDGDFVYSDPLGGGADLQISERDLVGAMAQASTPRAGFAVSRAKN